MLVTADSQLEGKVIWATLCCSKQRGSPNKKAEVFEQRAEPLFRKRLRKTTGRKPSQSALPLPDHNLSIRSDPGRWCCWRLVVLLCAVPSSSLELLDINPEARLLICKINLSSLPQLKLKHLLYDPTRSGWARPSCLFTSIYGEGRMRRWKWHCF